MRDAVLHLHDLAGKLASPSDPIAVDDKDPGDDAEHQAHAAEEAAGSLERHAVVHGVRDQREEPGEHVAAKGLRGEGGARVPVVRVGKVVEHCQIHREDPDRHRAHSTGGENPVLAGEGRPSEPEHADGEEGPERARSVEPGFGAFGLGHEAPR